MYIADPQKKRDGYLMVDHRASPGLPEAIALAAGYDPAMCREGKLYEVATKRCKHCRVTVVLNPFRRRPRNYCSHRDHGGGDHYICDVCAERAMLPGYEHVTFEQISDTIQEDVEKHDGQIGMEAQLMMLRAGLTDRIVPFFFDPFAPPMGPMIDAKPSRPW